MNIKGPNERQNTDTTIIPSFTSLLQENVLNETPEIREA